MSVQMKMEDVNTTALIQMVLTIVHALLDTTYTTQNFVQVIKIKFLNWHIHFIISFWYYFKGCACVTYLLLT